ncbi:MAG: DUF2514 family protein [Pantoea ananatis]|nr:DUF2514 family protein [Pantoea ananatis]
MSEIFKAYRYIIIAAILGLVGAGIGGLIFLYHHQYNKGYDAGIAHQVAEQQRINTEARLENEAAKTRLERQHAAEMAAVNADAVAATASVRRLQQQLDKIGRITDDYSGAVGISPPTGSTSRVLAYVLGESVERNRILAGYADKAAAAGRLCERQYDSLTGVKK